MCPSPTESPATPWISVPYAPELPVPSAPAAPAASPRRVVRSSRVRLRRNRRPAWVDGIEGVLRRDVVGQDDALQALIPALVRLRSKLRSPRRPLLTALLLGPTGVGKTETARALSRALFGRATGLVRVDCQEYAHGHELAKLIGSPPGYVGHRVEPLLSQRRLDQAHGEMMDGVAEGSEGVARSLDKDDGLVSILLLDEVEKAHPTLWNGLLHILEEGELTLGDNSKTSFARTLVLMTSNVGSREIDRARRPSLGFVSSGAADEDAQRAALAAAREAFPAEFLNRLDLQLVYRDLTRDDLGRILDVQLDRLNRRLVLAGAPLLLRVTPSAREELVDRGFDPRYGARPLRRAVETLLVDPLAELLATGELAAGDVVEVERGELSGELAFFKCAVEAGVVV